MHSAEAQVYVGWRMLGTDPAGIAFNLYRSTAGGTPGKLNRAARTQPPHSVDTPAHPQQTNS